MDCKATPFEEVRKTLMHEMRTSLGHILNPESGVDASDAHRNCGRALSQAVEGMTAAGETVSAGELSKLLSELEATGLENTEGLQAFHRNLSTWFRETDEAFV